MKTFVIPIGLVEFSIILSRVNYSEMITLEKMFPIAGPNTARMIMTTIATNTNIKAYSTNP